MVWSLSSSPHQIADLELKLLDTSGNAVVDLPDGTELVAGFTDDQKSSIKVKLTADLLSQDGVMSFQPFQYRVKKQDQREMAFTVMVGGKAQAEAK